MERMLAAAVLAALLLGACSDAPDIQGVWQNSDNSTLEIMAEGKAVMGQKGLEGDVQGEYRRSGDTVFVKSALGPGESPGRYNVFTLYYRNDSLHLERIALHRGSERRVLTGKELARRLGKSPEHMAFVRIAEEP